MASYEDRWYEPIRMMVIINDDEDDNYDNKIMIL